MFELLNLEIKQYGVLFLERETRERVRMVDFVMGEPMDGSIYHCVRNEETIPTMVLELDEVAGPPLHRRGAHDWLSFLPMNSH